MASYLTRRRNSRNKVDSLDIVGLATAIGPTIASAIASALSDFMTSTVTPAINAAIAAIVFPASAPPVTQPAAQTINFSLTSAHNRYRFPCTAALTITVPSAATLGSGFECWVHSIGFTTTIDGPGASNPTVTTGQMGRIFTLNGKVLVEIRSASDFTDIT